MTRRRKLDSHTGAVTTAALPPEPFWHFLFASRALFGAIVLILATLWGWFSWEAAREDNRFEGQPVANGVLLGIERRTTGGKGATLFYARYRFEMADGRTIDGIDVVSSSDKDQLEGTGRVSVQYVPGSPHLNRLYFPYLTSVTAARTKLADACVTAGLLALGVWLSFTGWRRAAREWEKTQARLPAGDAGGEV